MQKRDSIEMRRFSLAADRRREHLSALVEWGLDFLTPNSLARIAFSDEVLSPFLSSPHTDHLRGGSDRGEGHIRDGSDMGEDSPVLLAVAGSGEVDPDCELDIM